MAVSKFQNTIVPLSSEARHVTFKDEGLQYLEMMGTTQSMTQHHIPYNFCVQQHSVRNANLAIKLHVVGIFSGSVCSTAIKCSNINTVTYYSFLLHKVQKLRMTTAWNTIYCNIMSVINLMSTINKTQSSTYLLIYILKKVRPASEVRRVLLHSFPVLL